MKRLTIKEIAKMAGVSVTAVSFVLNGKPGVSEGTRAHVQKIIDETGFKPNLNSKKQLMNKSFNICLMINHNSSPFDDLFYFEITRGLLNRSRIYGYNVTINEPINSESELPDMVYIGDTDGIIFMQDISDVLTEKAIASGVPFVVVDSHSRSPKVTSINPDYYSATRQATEHLIRFGHQDIAMITSSTVPGFHRQTLQGFVDAMNEHGMTPVFDHQYVVTENQAYESAKVLLSGKKRPTAILCTVDIFAIGAMRCAKDLGLRVPEDVSFVGIDDIILSHYTEPKLTTVGIDKVHMGELAMDLLQEKIEGKTPQSVELPMQLIVRESVHKLN